MNKDNVEGSVDQVKGKIKQGIGEAVGNEHLANSGVADQMKGAVKETWGNAKDAIHDATHRTADEGEVHADKARHDVSNATQNVKDHVNASMDKHRS